MEIYNSTTQPPPSVMDKLHGLDKLRAEKAEAWLSFWACLLMRVGVPFLLVCCYFFICFLVHLVRVCWLGTRIGWGPKLIYLSKDEFNYLIDLPKNHPDLKRTKQPLLWVTKASVPFAPLSELKGSKMDQLPNLHNTHKTVGTLEELLIMP